MSSEILACLSNFLCSNYMMLDKLLIGTFNDMTADEDIKSTMANLMQILQIKLHDLKWHDETLHNHDDTKSVFDNTINFYESLIDKTDYDYNYVVALKEHCISLSENMKSANERIINLLLKS